MKIRLTFLIQLFYLITAGAHTKKEEITLLNKRIDSMKYVFEIEKNTRNDDIVAHNRELKEITSIHFQKEMRRDFQVQSSELSTFLTANQFVVVVENETNKLLTLFPGRYPQPIPNVHHSEIEHEEATKFWVQHLFIKTLSHG